MKTEKLLHEIGQIDDNIIAEALQAEKEKVQSIPGNEDFEPDATPYETVAICGDVEIKAEPNGNVRIFFDVENGVTLPDEYNFGGDDETEQQAKSVTQYLTEQYASVIAMKSPALNIFGDYPIITAKEAKKLLVQGHYISNVIYTADTEQFPGEKYIASVELVYRNGNRDEVFMPYYLFLVELPAMERDNGLKDYGAFYVPAVDGRYIENMPLWDGSFN